MPDKPVDYPSKIGKVLAPSDTWGEFDVAIYLTVRGETAREADEIVTKFCEELKQKLGDRLDLRAVETDK